MGSKTAFAAAMCSSETLAGPLPNSPRRKGRKAAACLVTLRACIRLQDSAIPGGDANVLAARGAGFLARFAVLIVVRAPFRIALTIRSGYPSYCPLPARC